MLQVAGRVISTSSREETLSTGFPNTLNRNGDINFLEDQSGELSVVRAKTRKAETSQEYGRNDGWINAWIVGDQLQAQSNDLHLALQEFSKETTGSQRARLNELQSEFEQTFRDVLKARTKRYPTCEDLRPWRTKMRSVTSQFCETALYYQNVFDVLNSQAPEYTSAAWGAVKLLLLLSVNSEQLKQNVAAYLQEIAEQYKILEVISDMKPQKSITDAVTSTYKDFLKFLKEALKYYNQGRLTRWTKNFSSPWEIRFQKTVERIKEGVSKVMTMAQVSSMLIVERIATTTDLTRSLVKENLQVSTQARNVAAVTLEGVRQVMTKEIESGENVNELLTKFNIFLSGLNSTRPNVVARSGIWKPELIESLLQNQIGDVSDLIKDVEDTTEYLCDFVGLNSGSKDQFHAFRNDVFPDLQALEDSAERLAKRHEFAAASVGPDYSAGTYNLQRNDEVLSWIESVESGLLWIDGHREGTKLDWTTNFSLEVESLASEDKTIINLGFFCGEYDIPEDMNTPVHILQSFLSQLICQNKRCFASKVCFENGLKKERFLTAARSFGDLWLLLNDCLKIIRPHCVYMIVNNIDSLHAHCIDGQNHTDLNMFLQLMEQLAQTDEFISKVLVTSRVPEVSTALFSVDGHQSRPARPEKHTLVKILHREQHKPELTRKKRRLYRVPGKSIVDRCGTLEARHIFDTIQSGRYESTDESQPSRRDGNPIVGSPSSDEDDFPFPYSRNYKSFLESADEDLDKLGGQTEWNLNSDSEDGQLDAHGKALMAEYDRKQTRKALDITELVDDDNDFDDRKNLAEPTKAARYQSDSGEDSNEAPLSAIVNPEPPKDNEAASALFESKDQTLSVLEFMDNGQLSE